MSDVYYAIHEGLRRPAAIKVLRASLAADDTHLQRFMQEARAAASLVHPNIVQVYDVGQDGQHRYIAQEFISGSNLRQYLAGGERASVPGESRQAGWTDSTCSESLVADRQLTIRESLSILLQVLAALNKSATSGIVHRDIKPENIMLTPDGDVKVADFGLARILLGDDPQLTRAGTTLGTPMYMSPEQIQEGQVDIRSDLYSLGVTLYHMLAGRPPFLGETPLALAMKHVQMTAPELVEFRSDLPLSLSQLVTRLLAKAPEDRFESPADILEYLRSHRAGDLAEHWPDQTLPLPGVALAAGLGRPGGAPLQATLVLQSKLRLSRTLSRRKWLAWTAFFAFVATSFTLGAAYAFATREPLFHSDEQTFDGIVKRGNVDEQYHWALLSTDSSPLSKWKAVAVFFPKEQGTLNRYYAGLASIQLARTHHERGDDEEAKRELQETLGDSQMGAVVKALAWLERAKFDDDAGKTAERDRNISRARELADGEKMTETDRRLLDETVRLFPRAIREPWFLNRT
jgi:serine/threonine-protein kinase